MCCVQCDASRILTLSCSFLRQAYIGQEWLQSTELVHSEEEEQFTLWRPKGADLRHCGAASSASAAGEPTPQTEPDRWEAPPLLPVNPNEMQLTSNRDVQSNLDIRNTS